MAKKSNSPRPNPAPARQSAAAPKAEAPAPKPASSIQLSLTAKLCILLAVIAMLVYANTIRNGYVLDDAMVCSKNSIVTQGIKGIPEIFSTPRMKGFGYLRNDNYRPLSQAVFAVEIQMFGPNPWAGHLFNMIFFAGCVVLLFLFFNQLFDGKKTAVSFIASLLFAVHPVHTEVVANIKSLDEILCFFFAFCSLNIFMYYMRSGKVWQLIAGFITLLLSYLAKETIVTFLFVIPFVFFFYVNNDRKRAIFISAAAVVATAIYLFVRAKVLNAYDANNPAAIEFIDNPLVTAPTGTRIATAIFILGKYLGLLFAPYPLICDYCFNSIPLVTFGNVVVLLALLIYAGLAVLGVYRAFKMPKDPWAFAILFFLATMALFTNIPFLMGTQMGERFLFFSSVGFCLAVALAMEKWIIKGEFSTAMLRSNKMLIILVPICLIFGGLTWARNAEWKDNYTLYKSDVPKAPNDCRLYFYLGDELAENVFPAETDTAKQRQIALEAVDVLKKSLEIYPGNAGARTEIGKAYFLLNRYDSAEYHLKIAIDSPYQSIAANNLGTIYLRTARYREAVDMYKKAVVIKADFVQALFNMGCAYLQLSRFDSAADCFVKTLSFDPNYGDAYQQLGTAYFFMGKMDQAEPYFKKALEYNPNDINALNNLGAVYLKKNNYPPAIEMFRKILAINPNYINAYSNIGQCYYNGKQYDAALEMFTKALSLDPRDVKDIPYIALCYKALGKMDLALKYEAIAKQYYSNFKL